MSRWGPSNPSRSTSPMPPSSIESAFVPSFADEPDFQLMDQIEWGADDASPLDELAAKPKPDSVDDPCGCVRPQDGSMTCNDLSCVLFACQEECRSNCTAGDACGNKRIQRREWKQLEAFQAGKKGKGLKILEDCRKGDLIAEYVGRAVNKRYLPHLFRRYANERKLYIMALDGDVFLDARRRGGISRYINHSCDPNCAVERWKVRGIMRAAVIAYKDIPAGTELSFDYQWERKRGRAPTKCHCHSQLCRGTLEVARSMEEEAMERKLSIHWKKPLIQRAGKEIINRCIRLFSNAAQEYYPADVTQYEESTGKHLCMYRHDLEEVWEDLSKENWMILDEDAEQFVIRKKTATIAAADVTSPYGMLLQGLPQTFQKNYVFVQTPIKELLVDKHLVERCQHSCRVIITPQQLSEAKGGDEELKRALEQSSDGTVWKFSIVGSDIPKALSILEKNVVYLTRILDLEKPSFNESTTLEPGSATQEELPTEVVLPRSIVDVVKRRLLPLLRDKCRSVNITFVPSESKSKQFAKLIVEGTLQSDVDAAKDHLWQQLNAACEESKAPKTPSGVFRDLGFLGGEMNPKDFNRLLEYDKTVRATKSQDAKEDLTRWSPFFASFESAQRCAIWVQSDSDKGRIDQSTNQRIAEATPNAPKKIYFGCDPHLVSKLWGFVQLRASEVARGVKYLYLGPDRLYQPIMMRKGGQFFEFVKKVTGASVTVDSMTGDHLRIDGRGASNSSTNPLNVDGDGNNALSHGELPENVSEGERAALAEELVRLQIELYRDHCIREQNWIFGRDWMLARRSCSSQKSNATSDAVGGSSPVPGSRSVASTTTTHTTKKLFEPKSMTNACMEIAEIISTLGLDGSVAAHSSVILYRFETIVSQKNISETQLKIREVLLACIFIANKAQKIVKWKKLDAVLGAAYKSFYPGVKFDPAKEEVLVWEDKVIAAEAEILETLDYDVFWRGFDWIVAAATEAGGMEETLASDALTFSVSGPVLAAGSDLWLTYGAEYVFAAAAGFLDAKLKTIFAALSLIPFKAFQAAEIITDSIKITGMGKKHSSHPLFKAGTAGLKGHLPRIKMTCALCMTGIAVEATSETEQRYRIIGERDRQRRLFRDVQGSIIKDFILPALDGISAESKCSIFVELNSQPGLHDIVLEGSWRALSIASYLLEQSIKGQCRLTEAMDDGAADSNSKSNIQSKGHPGLLQMKKIETADAWEGTIQSKVSNQSFWGRKTGGKCCVPGKIKESDLRHGGLRWWIPPRYGPSPTGSICDMFLVNNNDSGTLEALANLTHAFQGESVAYLMLSSSLTTKTPTLINNGTSDRYVAVSLQRWPSEKVAIREQGKGKNDEKAKQKKAKGRVMQIGFSAAALQEIQLLNQLHGLVVSPQGHPNFILPVGVALPSEIENGDLNLSTVESKPVDLKSIDEDIFSLTRSSLENEVAAQKERKRKDMVTGPHLVFQPAPFILQRFLRKKKRDSDIVDEQSISPAIFATWFHDLLSALLHCHANDIVLRNIQMDQIVVDHSGVAKIGGLYRARALSQEDKEMDIVKLARDEKRDGKSKESSRKKQGKSRKPEDDDILSNPYAPPEMLLGSSKFTKETDIWTLGCLFAHLLVNKPIYSSKEKDRQSILNTMYKMVGTPAKDNFEKAVKMPHFKKPLKKYGSGVGKALQYMVKKDIGEQHQGAIDLISQMLRLDPKDRITAAGALQHEYMQNYVENCNNESVRQQFVKDWMTLKRKLMRSSQTEQDDIKEKERGIKRKAMLMAASSNPMDNEDDDLYDMDDILGGGPSKEPKL